MKTKLFAAALAAMTMLGAAIPAAADQYDRRHDERWRGRAEITIRNDGRVFNVDRGDRLFYRLLDRPYHFRPGLTYAYTDRCNRNGCVVFVFDGRSRRPVDRIFAPHLPNRQGWREARGFDRDYNSFGRYDRDDRGWQNDDDRNYREGRDGRGDRDRDGDRRDGDRRDDRRLEGGPR